MLKSLILWLLLLIAASGFTQLDLAQKIDSLHQVFAEADGVSKLKLVEPFFDVLTVNTSKGSLPIIREMARLSQENNKDHELMLSWLMLTWVYQSQFEFDSMRQISQKGMTLAREIQNDSLLAKFYNALGVSHEKVGVLDSAEYFYLQALEADPSLKMMVYNNLGLAYNRKSNFEKAINYLEIALSEAQKKGKPRVESVILNNIGIGHMRLENVEKAKSYALRALDLKEQIKDERGKLYPMVLLTSLGLPPDEQSEYVNRALKQAKKVKDPIFERLFSAKYAEVLYKKGQLEEALNLLLPVYEQSRKAKSYDQSEVMRVLTNIYFELEQYQEAERIGLEMMALAKSKNAGDEIQNARELLMRIYRKQGKYQQALEMGTIFYQTRDSLRRKLNLDKLAALDAKLEDVEREKEIAYLNSELKQKDIRRKWMIAVAILLAFTLSLIIYFRNRRIKAQKAMIASEKETARQLEVMNEKLKGLDEMKNRLFTNITHEFRTPLTVMLGMAEQLELKTSDKEDQHKLALIRRNGRSLLSLIKQMLDLSKIENNKLKIHNVQSDILPYIRYIAESFHSLVNSQNILLRVESKEPEIIMDFDPEKIRQILSNLLSNAIKYTPSGGKVTVEVSKTEKGQLLVTVKDTGSGIPEADLPHIFDRFYQSNDSVAKSGGTGIGLALTKELVQLLDGTISAISKKEEGTAFVLSLPITQQAEFQETLHSAAIEERAPNLPVQESSIEQEVAQAIGNEGLPTLLIVEDNPDVVEYLTVCLQNQYQLEYAYNGRAGIEKALESIPDIIISDVMMPEKDGFELCDALKKDERTSHIPIVLLTAKADVESRISGLSRGADAYLAKPFHQEELMVVLAQLIVLRAKLRARYAHWYNEGPADPQNVQPLSSEFSMEEAFLTKAKGLIQENIGDSSFAVQEFCKTLGMSYPVVHRKLAALTGSSPSLFIRGVRLNQARLLLRSTDLSIAEIAYDCGFNDPKFFSRVFSQEFGQSPTAFKASVQE